MTDAKTAPDPNVILDATTGNGIVIIDAGIPTARGMREALALLPAGGPVGSTICINPFDPSFHAALDELEPTSRGDWGGELSVG